MKKPPSRALLATVLLGMAACLPAVSWSQAASPGLGTINHTLMTVEAARAVGLEVAAVVVTPWPAEPPTVEASNRDAIERLGDVRVETLVTIDLVDPERWPALDLP